VCPRARNDGYGDGVLQETFGLNPSDFGLWFYQGTSMAAPHVSGVAALLIADGVSGPDAVREALLSSATDIDAVGWDEQSGAGLLDAFAALMYDAGPVIDVAVTGLAAPETAETGSVVEVTVEVTNNSTEASVTTDVVLYADGDEVGRTAVTDLAAGNTTPVVMQWNTAGAAAGSHVLEATALPVAEETNTGNNSQTSQIELQTPLHDLAVEGIDVPSMVVQGDTVRVSVTVINTGTYSETADVVLTDTYDDVVIGTAMINVAAGATEIVPFTWYTSGEALVDHLLEAVVLCAGDEDPSNDSTTATVTVTDAVTVSATVSVALASKAVFTWAEATVTVLDDAGAPVSGATVSVEWSGDVVGASDGTTDASGQAVVQSTSVKKAGPGTTFTATVVNVLAAGYEYDGGTPSATIAVE